MYPLEPMLSTETHITISCRSRLLRLPPELLLHILTHLSPQNLLTLNHTSSTLRFLATQILVTRLLPCFQIRAITSQEGRGIVTAEFIFTSYDPSTSMVVFSANS